MALPVSRREFDALTQLAKLLSESQATEKERGDAILAALNAVKVEQDLLAKEVERQATDLQLLRAVMIALLRQGTEQLPSAMQGGVIAALQSLEASRREA
ncbi:MAG TPA: hypothetical protein VD932_01105 [Aquabacterium sp.]|nr:hypothetical protein [Aquabacterium sp.]